MADLCQGGWEVTTLSADAKYLGYSMFSRMMARGSVTFKMVESRPSDRTQAALDELVAAGLISCEPFNRFGGVVYKPLGSFKPAKCPPGPWPVVVPTIPAPPEEGGAK